MTPRRWFSDRAALRALGLRLETVRRYGKSARWVCCKACGRSILALNCTDCGWNVSQLALAATHVKGLEGLVKGLPLFACRAGCNREAIEHPPGRVLVRMAEAAAIEPVEPPRRREQKKSKVTGR